MDFSVKHKFFPVSIVNKTNEKKNTFATSFDIELVHPPFDFEKGPKQSYFKSLENLTWIKFEIKSFSTVLV